MADADHQRRRQARSNGHPNTTYLPKTGQIPPVRQCNTVCFSITRIAAIARRNLGFDPIAVSVVLSPLFFLLGMVLYRVYYLCFEKRGQESLRGLAFFFGILFITEVALVLIFGVVTFFAKPNENAFSPT